MQTLYVPKYNLHYRVNPRNPRELQWSRKPFGPATQWQHAMSFKNPIRALDLDDETKQGVVVLNDSTTYVGSGVRTWGRKFYPAGTRIYSLYAIGESKMKKLKIKIHESSGERTVIFDTPMGSVEVLARYPGVFMYFPEDDDGRNDDCVYYFSLQRNKIVQRGWNYGRGFDEQFLVRRGPWLDSIEAQQDPEYMEYAFHNLDYQNYLLDRLCKILGSATY